MIPQFDALALPSFVQATEVPLEVSDRECKALEPAFPLNRDPDFSAWKKQLARLATVPASLNVATDPAKDGRRMKDIQVLSEPIGVQSVKENALSIIEKRVLLADIDGVHVGFCVSAPGSQPTDPLFFQVIAVVPEARGQGIGTALLSAAAMREPHRDIALATEDANSGARALNEKFAQSIGASITRIAPGTYSDLDLGIEQTESYRPWLIQRPARRS